ncbi:hypothetical protein N9Z93_01645 [Akkermansiaceae bacterium]|nr:hypothetical protein [Akkermansiaceae bacterium]
MLISYLEFKLNKEIAYEDTFEKDKEIRKEYDEYVEQTKREEEKMLDKPIYFNVYKVESDNPKAPTFSWNGFTVKEDIVIKAGTKIDMTFWGNSTSQKDGKPNPHLKISNHVPREDKGGVSNRDINYPTKEQVAQQDNNYLDDDINF